LAITVPPGNGGGRPRVMHAPPFAPRPHGCTPVPPLDTLIFRTALKVPLRPGPLVQSTPWSEARPPYLTIVF